MVKYKGRLLRLGTLDDCNCMFSKDCEVIFPGKIPVLFDFCEDMAIGIARIKRDKLGLLCEVDLYEHIDLVEEEILFVGGEYKNIKSHMEMQLEEDVQVITKCRLIGMSVTFNPCDSHLIIHKVHSQDIQSL